MARKVKSTNKAKKKKGKHEDEQGQGFINPDVKHGIYIVLLWVLGLVSLLSLVSLAGTFGEYWSKGLTLLFGWGDFVLPFVFIILGYLLLRPSKFEIRPINYWGLVLGTLSLYAILHWTQGQELLVKSIGAGRGGGYVGLVLSWPLMKVFGPVAGFIILVAFLVIALLLIFNTSIHRLLGEDNLIKRVYSNSRHWLMSRHYNGNEAAGEDYDDYEDEEGVEEGEAEDETIEDDEAEKGELTCTSVPVGGQEQLVKVPRRKMPKIELPMELLSSKISRPNSGDIRQNQQVIQKTLANFGIAVEMDEVSVGPTVTQYTLRPAEGVKVSQIHGLQNDIALALAAHPIRIEAPIPGKSLVGIEVPNQSVAIVSLREVLDSSEFKKERSSSLTLPLGKDVAGKTYIADLDRMPHLLIAGATGSGKSIAINIMLISLMFQNQPSDLKFILVDPKRVELTTYADTPYLLTPVITDVKKTINSLRWAVGEMDRRYNLFSASGHRKLATYNKSANKEVKLPYIVIVIDELADLMAVAANDVEAAIVRLAQMARAVGIHLVVATQRPSVDVITGLIKANITSRIAFSVASLVDSRTILDSSGAEKLLGRGDMLFTSAELSKPKRLQGAFVSDRDIDSVASYLRQKARPDYIGGITQAQAGGSDLASGVEETDELLEEAKEVILRAGKASASLLQRRLRVGYARAARILDILEGLGLIGPADGSKPREILFTEVEIIDDEMLDEESDELDYLKEPDDDEEVNENGENGESEGGEDDENYEEDEEKHF